MTTEDRDESGFDPLRPPFKTRDGRDIDSYVPFRMIGWIRGREYAWRVDGTCTSSLSRDDLVNADAPAPTSRATVPADIGQAEQGRGYSAPSPPELSSGTDDGLDVEARAIFQILWRECPERFMRYEDDQPMWLEAAASARAVRSERFQKTRADALARGGATKARDVIRALARIVQTMVDNDPDEPIADGGYRMLDLWRHDATPILSDARVILAGFVSGVEAPATRIAELEQQLATACAERAEALAQRGEVTEAMVKAAETSFANRQTEGWVTNDIREALIAALAARSPEQHADADHSCVTSIKDLSVLKDVIAAFRTRFPGWWLSCGLCELTGHASCGPDYNSQEHGDRLRREFPESLFDSGFHSDLAPGDGWGRVSEAINDCIAQAETIIRKADAIRAGADHFPDARNMVAGVSGALISRSAVIEIVKKICNPVCALGVPKTKSHHVTILEEELIEVFRSTAVAQSDQPKGCDAPPLGNRLDQIQTTASSAEYNDAPLNTRSGGAEPVAWRIINPLGDVVAIEAAPDTVSWKGRKCTLEPLYDAPQPTFRDGLMRAATP